MNVPHPGALQATDIAGIVGPNAGKKFGSGVARYSSTIARISLRETQPVSVQLPDGESAFRRSASIVGSAICGVGTRPARRRSASMTGATFDSSAGFPSTARAALNRPP